MIGNSDFEKIFYLWTRLNPTYFEKIGDNFYENSNLNSIHIITKSFYKRFKEIPTKEQLLAVSKQDKFKDKLSDGIINTIFDEDLTSYDPNWVKETAESWILWKNLDQSLIDTLSYVKSASVTPDNVRSIVDHVKTLINDKNNIIFDESLGLDFFEVESHIPPVDSKIPSLKRWVDERIGGYRKGSLIVYGGVAGSGKSIFLANDAASYIKAGYDVAFISAEMADVDLIHRVGANVLNTKISEYEKFVKNKAGLKNRLANMKMGAIPPGNLFIKEYPTSEATIPQIEAYLRQLELVKGIKLSVIIIDYINILANHRNPNSENMYLKIKQLSEDMRAMAKKNDWVIITATQLNKSAYDSSDFSMGSIAESSGLNHTCDVIYGIIQDELMYSNFEYWLKILKIRNGSGKHMKCLYKINYDYMRLSETEQVINNETGF